MKKEDRYLIYGIIGIFLLGIFIVEKANILTLLIIGDILLIVGLVIGFYLTNHYAITHVKKMEIFFSLLVSPGILNLFSGFLNF